MLRARALPLLLIAVTLCAPCRAQINNGNPPDFGDKSHPPAALQQRGPDWTIMLAQANDLKQLSDAIPADIGKLSQGMISKDLSERLKKIEKLAKKLREQVQQ
jgi:hypothetical protein